MPTQNTKITHIFPCPSCTKPSVLSPDNPSRPFCSPRCKLIDLGEWATEEHKISGEPAEQGLYLEDDYLHQD